MPAFWLDFLPASSKRKKAGWAAAPFALSAEPFPELVMSHLEDLKLFFFFFPSLSLWAGVCLANETFPAAPPAPAQPGHRPGARVLLALLGSLAETS